MNWGQLKTAVAAYGGHRTDLGPVFDTFLTLAEERIYSGEASAPKVRCAAMRQFSSWANGTPPAGFLEAIKVAEAGSPDKPLDYVPLDRMPARLRAFSWDGPTLVLSQDQGFPVDVTYYAKLTTPVDDSDTNWLLTNHARIYLASMLVEVGRWSRDPELTAAEAGNYASAVNALNSAERAASISGSALLMRKGY